MVKKNKLRLGDLFPELDPHPGQREILEDRHRFKVIAAGRRFGKGHCSMQEAAIVGIRNPRCEIWVISPSHVEQEAMWLKSNRVLAEASHPLFVQKGNPKGLFVKDVFSTRGYRKFLLYNGSMLYFKSSHDPNSLRGAGDSLQFVIVDEAAYVKKEAWNVLRPALMDRGANAMLISTPNDLDPKNWFYERWLWGQTHVETVCPICDGHGGDCESCEGGTVRSANPLKKESYQSWQFSSYDNPFVTDDEINLMIEEEGLSNADIQREVYANFVDSEGAVFTLENISECEWGEMRPPIPGHSYVMGIDLAQVADYTVATIMNLENAHVDHIERFQGSWTTQIQRITTLYERYFSPFTVVDATQLGGSVIEHELRKAGIHNLKGYKFNGPNKVRLIDALRVAVEQAAVSFPHYKPLHQEMVRYQAKKLPSGHLRYGCIKSETDDCVDSLALAWHGYQEKNRRYSQVPIMSMLGGEA